MNDSDRNGEERKDARALDPVTLEIIRHGLGSITEQIETNIMRTAYSPLVYEYKDYAVGMVDVEGRLISQSRGGIPIFVANALGRAVQDGIHVYGLDNINRGDIIISNHAATLGQHLNNMAMYTPVFADEARDEVVAFMGVIVHHIDVSGRYVGSCLGNRSTDIFQEGIQYRSVKLYAAGRRVEEIYRIMLDNTRFPAMFSGGLEAQLGGVLMGRDLFSEMIARYGAATLQRAFLRIWEQSERKARAAVSAIPDGTYGATASLDDDGISLGSPVPIDVKVVVSGDELTVDFSDLAPQMAGPFNSGRYGGGITAARMALKYLTTPHETANEGCFRPLKVILPDGTFLSAGKDAPMALFSAPIASVIDVIIRALEEPAPGLVTGGHHATFGIHLFHGKDPRTGELYQHFDAASGGYGASARQDGGGPYKTMIDGDTKDIPVEIQEALYPLRVESVAYRVDSGGPGKFRGGLGVDKVYRAMAPMKFTASFDRTLTPAWGVCGGRDGDPGRAIVERPGRPAQVALNEDDIELEAGDVVRILSGGGGGFGPPQERDVAQVADDVRLGFVTPEGARADYGVALDSELRVLADETAEERRRRSSAQAA